MSDYTPKVGDVIDVALSGKVTQVVPRDGFAVVYLTTNLGHLVGLRTDSATSITKHRPDVALCDVWLDQDGGPWVVADDGLLHVVSYNGRSLSSTGQSWETIDSTVGPLTLAVRDGKAVPA